MRKNIIRLILVMVIMVPAVAISAWWYRHYVAEAKSRSQRAGAEKSIHGVTVSGTIRCRQKSALAAEIIAPVTAMPVEEGRHVAQGEVLIELDSSIVTAECAKARAQVELAEHQLAESIAGPRKQEITKASESVIRAQSVLDFARKEHARLTEARRRDIATTLEVSRADSQVKKAKSDLAWAKAHLDLLRAGTRPEQIARVRSELTLAKAELKRCEAMRSKYVLRAPHEGIVTVRYVNVGEVVSPGQVLLRVHNIKAMEVRAQVQESQLRSVGKGSRAMVLSDAWPDSPLKAFVRDILPRVDSQQGTVTVLVEFDGKPGVALMDGMAVDVAIFSSQQQ